MRRAISFAAGIGLAMSLALGCQTAPTYVYDLMDAEGETDRAEAIDTCAEFLASRRTHPSVRLAAARTLGRLQTSRTDAVQALTFALRPRESVALRNMAAWALGESRSSASLGPLIESLRQPLPETTSRYVLEALAKHYGVLIQNQEQTVQAVEALVYFSGNRQTAVPPAYDLLGARLRTLEVNALVLERHTERAQTDRNPQAKAALYNAAFELLAKLEDQRDEIVAAETAWRPRVQAAIDAAQQALSVNDPETNLYVLWALGRLARDREIGGPAARRLLGDDGRADDRPTLHRRAAQRLIAAWAFAQMEIHALGPRRALLLDLLSKELEGQILEVLADGARQADTLDGIQRLMGVREAP